MPMFEQPEEGNDSPIISFQRSGSLSCPIPYLITDSRSRKSFSYSKIPQKPLKLTVIKLDDSSFDIEVAKTATVAQLKQAVESVFSHLPNRGPKKISWPFVWGHFCLTYDGQKLLTDTDAIGIYGIKDGDKLQFVRHLSISYNMVKERPKKEDPDLDEPSVKRSYQTDLRGTFCSFFLFPIIRLGASRANDQKTSKTDSCIVNRTSVVMKGISRTKKVFMVMMTRIVDFSRIADTSCSICLKGGSHTASFQVHM
ncbi:uncharacterized protein [Coffea arabica]|uniref:Uncharacterized protein isoform X2 n=1 Tax=Coffea arabica TaxID=13443 RepID=A0A6P6U295_COFAR